MSTNVVTTVNKIKQMLTNFDNHFLFILFGFMAIVDCGIHIQSLRKTDTQKTKKKLLCIKLART